MNRTSTLKLLLSASLLLCLVQIAAAATLHAKVVEVRSGNTLVVTNINRPITVRLKAVFPPEVGQPFNDAAREHLKALVLDKIVDVDYTHFADNLLEARVFLNGVDIGSQMLRDGVAWYDRAYDYQLSQTDRELYSQCENAARVEKRGLWQDQSAIAPWEYRRLQQARINSIVNPQNLDWLPKVKQRTTNANTSLSSRDLFSELSPTYMSGVLPTFRPITANGTFDVWTRWESPVSHYSIMVPSNGLETSAVVADSASGLPVTCDLVIAGSDRGLMMLSYGRGPNGQYTDENVFDKSIKNMVDGWNTGASKQGSAGLLTLKRGRDLKMSDYVGRQYSMSGEVFTGVARVFTKQSGKERQVFVLIAITVQDSEAIGTRFVNSFKITQ